MKNKVKKAFRLFVLLLSMTLFVVSVPLASYAEDEVAVATSIV